MKCVGWTGNNQNNLFLSQYSKIDILEDMKLLCQNIKLRDLCLKNYRISNLVLKIGASYGLTLYDIGRIIYREGFEESPSVLETLVAKANKINNLFEAGNYNLFICSKQ